MERPIVSGLQWRVEEACLNAWPALREVLLDGWLLRFSEGLTRRANSANALAPVGSPALTKCQCLYRRLGLPTIFRVLSFADPAIDQQLAKAGYTSEGESCVLYGKIDELEAVPDAEVRLVSVATAEWFAAMSALQSHTPDQALIYRRIVGQLAIPTAFALLSANGQPVALAYGAFHRGLLCYESVITDRRRLRQGYGRRLVAALAAWAKENGGHGACLQVEANNLPARALYDAIGLKRELYRYHYRRESRRSRGEVHYSAVSSTSSKTLVSSRRRPGWGVIPARNTRLVDEIKAELAEAAEHSQQTGESARRPPSLARVLDAIP
jgi:N-acetylglutamate synthase